MQTPARFNRISRTIETHDNWKHYTPSEKAFIIWHEKGHRDLNTRDEKLADEYAIKNAGIASAIEILNSVGQNLPKERRKNILKTIKSIMENTEYSTHEATMDEMDSFLPLLASKKVRNKIGRVTRKVGRRIPKSVKNKANKIVSRANSIVSGLKQRAIARIKQSKSLSEAQKSALIEKLNMITSIREIRNLLKSLNINDNFIEDEEDYDNFSDEEEEDYDNFSDEDEEDYDNFSDEEEEDYDNFSDEEEEDYDNFSDEEEEDYDNFSDEEEEDFDNFSDEGEFDSFLALTKKGRAKKAAKKQAKADIKKQSGGGLLWRKKAAKKGISVGAEIQKAKNQAVMDVKKAKQDLKLDKKERKAEIRTDSKLKKIEARGENRREMVATLADKIPGTLAQMQGQETDPEKRKSLSTMFGAGEAVGGDTQTPSGIEPENNTKKYLIWGGVGAVVVAIAVVVFIVMRKRR